MFKGCLDAKAYRIHRNTSIGLKQSLAVRQTTSGQLKLREPLKKSVNCLNWASLISAITAAQQSKSLKNASDIRRVGGYVRKIGG